MEDPEETDRYLGPGGIVMKFRNFNPLKDPGIEASQYENSFPDVGREEMERRFAERRGLFLNIYDRKQPRQSLHQYVKSAQRKEGYRYQPPASSGPVSMFFGGSVPAKNRRKGELPECQLLGFINGSGRIGCLAHPLAETSQGCDGRDEAGFFSHTGCCGSIGCEASKEFPFLSAPALKIFDKAVEEMSWYEYSRHSTSVLVYYLRAYDHILQKLDERERLDPLSLPQLVEFTNNLYDEWPLRETEKEEALSRDSIPMNSLELLSTDIPLAERIMYIALGTGFFRNRFAGQLQQARDCIQNRIQKIEKPGAPPRCETL